jgi:circadian clock protein KaiB
MTTPQDDENLPADRGRIGATLEAEPPLAPAGRFVLCLYVAGNAPRSIQALANLRAVCERYLPGRYELEVVDIYQQPHLAQKAQLVAVPTLIRRAPGPLRRITGDFSSVQQLLVGLEPRPSPPEQGAL